ncbi:DUF397 domain-containing protein [Streptomyces sp. NPDC051985]|uniref:DUF397 domain-containing protein n=1 Tax=Streptomyces sp. NPDC051985 TaxID=3155807 RepID=UPI0034407DA4
MTRTGTLRWFKSSYSDGGGGDCVETAYTWRRLEISPCPQAIHIRDSKTGPAGPHLTLSPTAWAAFLESAG